MHRKSETFQSDRGREDQDKEFMSYLIDNDILSQLTALGTPQQNGIAERRNRTMLDMMRSMLSDASLPKFFWGYTLQTAVYLINRISSKCKPKTPFELWTGHKASFRHIRILGCRAHVKKAEVDKLELRIELCLFVGYPKETKGGYFYSPKDNKVFVSTNTRFLEDDHITNHKSNNKVVLEELDTDEIDDSTKDQNDEIIIDQPVVRSETT